MHYRAVYLFMAGKGRLHVSIHLSGPTDRLATPATFFRRIKLHSVFMDDRDRVKNSVWSSRKKARLAVKPVRIKAHY